MNSQFLLLLEFIIVSEQIEVNVHTSYDGIFERSCQQWMDRLSAKLDDWHVEQSKAILMETNQTKSMANTEIQIYQILAEGLTLNYHRIDFNSSSSSEILDAKQMSDVLITSIDIIAKNSDVLKLISKRSHQSNPFYKLYTWGCDNVKTPVSINIIADYSNWTSSRKKDDETLKFKQIFQEIIQRTREEGSVPINTDFDRLFGSCHAHIKNMHPVSIQPSVSEKFQIENAISLFKLILHTAKMMDRDGSIIHLISIRLLQAITGEISRICPVEYECRAIEAIQGTFPELLYFFWVQKDRECYFLRERLGRMRNIVLFDSRNGTINAVANLLMECHEYLSGFNATGVFAEYEIPECTFLLKWALQLFVTIKPEIRACHPIIGNLTNRIAEWMFNITANTEYEERVALTINDYVPDFMIKIYGRMYNMSFEHLSSSSDSSIVTILE